MKQVLIIAFCSICVLSFAQTDVIPLGACAPQNASAHKHSSVTPMNGNTTLGSTYSQTACGLNYVYDSAHIETRYFQAVGSLPGCGGSCSWHISGLPSCYTIDKAYVWALCSYVSVTPPSGSVTITNPTANVNTYAPATGGPIGIDASKCWGETGSCTYRYDVTSCITGNGNYSFSFPGFTGTPSGLYFTNSYDQIDGATLFIIYHDLGASYQGTLNIWDGAIEQSGPTSSETMTGFNVCATPSLARAFTISSDHQPNVAATHQTTLNNVAGNYPNLFYDEDEAPVTLTSGQTSSIFGMDGSLGSDCYLWGVMGLYYQTTTCATCNPSAVTVSVTSTAATCGNANGSANVTAIGIPPYTYSWSPGGQTTTSISNITAGIYTVTVTDSTGCSTITTVTVAGTIPQITAGPNSTICAGGTVNLIASGAVTYTWVPTSTLSNTTIANPTAFPSTTTTYTVTGTDTSGCIASATVTVTITTPPIVTTSGNLTICLGKSTIVCSSVSGGTSPYAYLWSSGGQTTSCITVSPTANTAYPITVTDANGCTGSSNGSVNLFAPVFISAINSQLICNGDSTQLLANASNGPQPYSWNWIPSGSLTNPNTQNPWAHPNTSTSYTVTVTDADGCTADTTVNMTVQTIPNGSFNWVTGKISCDGITLDFRDNLSTNTVSGLWSFGDGSTDTSIFNHDSNYTPYSPLPHAYPFNGTYTVTLTTNNGPCHTNKDTVLTIPDVSKLIAIKAANVFTPDNGDALNNCFHPAFCDLSNTTSACPQDSLTEEFKLCIDLEVYDRWGIKVFESTDTQKCWDGTTKSGAKAKEGTYYYIAKFKDTVIKGYVELLR